MRSGTKSIERSRLRSGGKPSSAGTGNPDTSSLASLAAMNFSRQSPGLILPAISDVPTSHCYTDGTDTTLVLAQSLVTLGLGSPQLWKRHNANPSLFVQGAINEWLESIGAKALKHSVEVSLAIVENLDETPAPEGKLFVLLENGNVCGFLKVGTALSLLEKERPGLGRAFYLALLDVMYTWMEVYDMRNAADYFERWKESIEMDMEVEATEASFLKYCRDNDVHFPDLEAVTPECAKALDFRKVHAATTLLQQHRHGKYAEWIEPLLTMASIRKGKDQLDLSSFEGPWDDGPLPTWLVAFEMHDPITQAFDEEGQHFLESAHAPTWLDTLDPADARDLKRVLDRVQAFVAVNQQLVKLEHSFNDKKWRATLGNLPQHRLDQKPRAA